MLNCPSVLSGMSHEVRTHMNAIVAFSYLMNSVDCDSSEREEFSNQIMKSCEQLIGLFDNFIDSAFIESGNSKAESKICRLNSILDGLLTEFRDSLANEKDIVLIAENQSAENCEVAIDSEKVFRVIRTLFQNSLRNTKSGYIKVGYYFRDDKLTFYVIDSGQGFFKCKEFLQNEDLNESLSRYCDTTTAINLTLAKQYIKMLCGTLNVECNGLTGTSINFTIPVKVINRTDIYINSFSKSNVAI
jgi:K+-sensing histidine kinase KdpD